MGRRLKQHTSPLYEILDSAKICANEIETIGIGMKSPIWRNKVKTVIAPTREDTIQYANNDESDIKIYTDGSSSSSLKLRRRRCSCLDTRNMPCKNCPSPSRKKHEAHCLWKWVCWSNPWPENAAEARSGPQWHRSHGGNGQPGSPMSVQCKKIDPRQLPRGRRQETHIGNWEQMAENKAETAMGARAWGDQRKRKGWHRGEKGGRRTTQELKKWALSPHQRDTKQQIGNQANAEGEDMERIREGIPGVSEIWQGNQIWRQSSLTQL